MKWSSFKFALNKSNSLYASLGKVTFLTVLANTTKSNSLIIYLIILTIFISLIFDFLKLYNQFRTSNIEINSLKKTEEIKNNLFEFLVDDYKSKDVPLQNKLINHQQENLKTIFKLISKSEDKSIEK